MAEVFAGMTGLSHHLRMPGMETLNSERMGTKCCSCPILDDIICLVILMNCSARSGLQVVWAVSEVNNSSRPSLVLVFGNWQLVLRPIRLSNIAFVLLLYLGLYVV